MRFLGFVAASDSTRCRTGLTSFPTQTVGTGRELQLAYTSVMSRLRRLLESRRIFFVTTHFVAGALPISGAERDIVLQCMAKTRARRGCMILGYCLMPTHLHLMLIPSDSDTMGNVMREIKLTSSKQVSAMRGKAGKFWQARSFDRIMRDRKELSETLEYIHLNPVKDGLVRGPQNWKWSSWAAWQTPGTCESLVDVIELPIDERTPLQW
jgi:REP element-mobilizing transposase RayT